MIIQEAVDWALVVFIGVPLMSAVSDFWRGMATETATELAELVRQVKERRRVSAAKDQTFRLLDWEGARGEIPTDYRNRCDGGALRGEGHLLDGSTAPLPVMGDRP